MLNACFFMKTLRTKTDGTYNTEVDDREEITIIDHLTGFDKNFKCSVLDEIQHQTLHQRKILTEYVVSSAIKNNYPRLDFTFDINSWFYENGVRNLQCTDDSYKKDFLNFICTFNNSPHVSRKLVTSALYHYKMFDPQFSSKTFPIQPYEVIGTLYDYVGEKAKWYKKFFVGDTSTDFYHTLYQFGGIVSADHGRNQQHLNPRIDRSFLHIVSETMATSYYPFVTEKFLYSVSRRGLFLAWAQPGWHKHVDRYYGFKKFAKIFNYHFDTIENPIERLIALLDMVSKYSRLSKDDWHDLYQIEKDVIEYNYEHFQSGDYIKHLHNKALKQQIVTPINQDILEIINRASTS